jgi:hypothetical protein
MLPRAEVIEGIDGELDGFAALVRRSTYEASPALSVSPGES